MTGFPDRSVWLESSEQSCLERSVQWQALCTDRSAQPIWQSFRTSACLNHT